MISNSNRSRSEVNGETSNENVDNESGNMNDDEITRNIRMISSSRYDPSLRKSGNEINDLNEKEMRNRLSQHAKERRNRKIIEDEFGSDDDISPIRGRHRKSKRNR